MENAEVVLGAPVTDSAVLDLAQMTACLSINVRAIGNGKGGDVMGHPLNALAWLAGKLAAVGTPLRRGMIVMTGSIVPIQYPIAGDRVLVDISGLGTGELAVTYCGLGSRPPGRIRCFGLSLRFCTSCWRR